MALTCAQPEGYVRLFLDERDLLADLLRTIVANAGEDSVGAYARRLLGAAEREYAGEAAPAHAAGQSMNHLSPQELRVLQLLAAGHSNQEIAHALVVSVNTIKTQLKSIYRKLSVTNRVEACMVAQRQHLLWRLYAPQRYDDP